jgi:hypothetical protein
MRPDLMLKAFREGFWDALFYFDGDSLEEEGCILGMESLKPETIARIHEECDQFCKRFAPIIAKNPSRAGQDFYTGRVGHGTGFWDGHWQDKGELLGSAADEFGDIEVYGDGNGGITISWYADLVMNAGMDNAAIQP